MLTVLIRLIQLQRPRRALCGREGERMISLNYRDSRPIYEQIRDGLRKLIVTGALGADEKLPSVRALAAQLAINPNTIQRAYNELEGEGKTKLPPVPPTPIAPVFSFVRASSTIWIASLCVGIGASVISFSPPAFL